MKQVFQRVINNEPLMTNTVAAFLTGDVPKVPPTIPSANHGLPLILWNFEEGKTAKKKFFKK